MIDHDLGGSVFHPRELVNDRRLAANPAARRRPAPKMRQPSKTAGLAALKRQVLLTNGGG
jgi:hypothetical protein